MRQLMPQPWKHPKTGVYYFRKVVPERLRRIVGRREIKLSLRTRDLREAKLHYPEAASRAEQILQRADGGAVRLTHKQILALAGEWYKRELAAREDEPEHPDDLALEAMSSSTSSRKVLRLGIVNTSGTNHIRWRGPSLTGNTIPSNF